MKRPTFRRPALWAATTALIAVAAPAAADYETVASPHSVSDTADALVAAIEAAGASVIARVDHAGAAASADMVLPGAELIIFGNPQIGTPVMQEDIRAGLVLPLRVLVYEDAEGATQMIYEEPEEMFEDFGIDDDLEIIEQMECALEALTAKAAE